MSGDVKSAQQREKEQRVAYAEWVRGLSAADRGKLAAVDKGLLRPLSGNGAGGVGARAEGGEAGDFADKIGESVGDVEVEVRMDLDEAASPEERRFDELMACAPVEVGAAVARQFVRRVMALDASHDRMAVGNGAADLESARAIVRREAVELGAGWLVEVRDAKLAKFRARVLLMAAGWPNEKESMRGLAKDYGYSVTHVANLVEADQATYGLPKNQFNKSAEATATYQETNGK